MRIFLLCLAFLLWGVILDTNPYQDLAYLVAICSGYLGSFVRTISLAKDSSGTEREYKSYISDIIVSGIVVITGCIVAFLNFLS